jgi:hypothetical protein
MSSEMTRGRCFANSILTVGIALVWLVNGLFCKLLNLVPRHEIIVARILGDGDSVFATKTIGALEILMALWVVSRVKSRWCALFQIFIVATMNVIEFILAPDLLLFGRANAMVAVFFIAVVFLNEFAISRRGWL